MTATAKKLLQDALTLSVEERAELVEALSDSLHLDPTELSPGWRDEVRSRIEQLESGEAKSVPWNEVDARIRSALTSK